MNKDLARAQRLDSKACSVWEGTQVWDGVQVLDNGFYFWMGFNSWMMDLAKIMRTAVNSEDSFYLPLCQG